MKTILYILSILLLTSCATSSFQQRKHLSGKFKAPKDGYFVSSKNNKPINNKKHSFQTKSNSESIKLKRNKSASDNIQQKEKVDSTEKAKSIIFKRVTKNNPKLNTKSYNSREDQGNINQKTQIKKKIKKRYKESIWFSSLILISPVSVLSLALNFKVIQEKYFQTETKSILALFSKIMLFVIILGFIVGAVGIIFIFLENYL